MVKIEVSKPVCLVDEEVAVKVTGLRSRDRITLIATTEQNEVKFWSHGIFQANEDGVVDCTTDQPLRGSYDDVDAMGLFWSLTSAPSERRGQRLFTANAENNRKYTLSVFPENDDPVIYLNNDSECLATVEHYRGYKSKTVKRIPVRHGRIQGTVFIPEGQGPFPAVIDLFGALVYLFESRAALLASHGFVTFALAYMNGDGLPTSLLDIEFNYFKEAADWFISQEYVQQKRIGVIGICLGGSIACWMAENIPKVRAVVSINAATAKFDSWTNIGEHAHSDASSVGHDFLWVSDEGLVMKDMGFRGQEPTDWYLKPWRHGAQVLVTAAGDDLMVPIVHQVRWYENIPKDYKSNVRFVYYHGAGHLIEPPYMPCVRSLYLGFNGLKHAGIFPEKYHNLPLMSGGYPKPHAAAQKDCWTRAIKFLKENLQNEKAWSKL